MVYSKIEQKIYSMLTESTGSHFLDSGGAYGRNWERNKKKTIDDFKNEPEAYVELEKYNDDAWANVTVSVFHYLTTALDLDGLCDEFNSMPCDDWNSDEFYGVSSEGEDFILSRFEKTGDSFNTYNWDCPLGQVLQGCELEHIETGDRYVLIQIHGGCDVRGGYTDAHLFKIECEYFLDVGCFCSELGADYLGEWIGSESGSCVDDNHWIVQCEKHKVSKGESKIFEAGLYYCGM